MAIAELGHVCFCDILYTPPGLFKGWTAGITFQTDDRFLLLSARWCEGSSPQATHVKRACYCRTSKGYMHKTRQERFGTIEILRTVPHASSSGEAVTNEVLPMCCCPQSVVAKLFSRKPGIQPVEHADESHRESFHDTELCYHQVPHARQISPDARCRAILFGRRPAASSILLLSSPSNDVRNGLL